MEKDHCICKVQYTRRCVCVIKSWSEFCVILRLTKLAWMSGESYNANTKNNNERERERDFDIQCVCVSVCVCVRERERKTPHLLLYSLIARLFPLCSLLSFISNQMERTPLTSSLLSSSTSSFLLLLLPSCEHAAEPALPPPSPPLPSLSPSFFLIPSLSHWFPLSLQATAVERGAQC